MSITIKKTLSAAMAVIVSLCLVLAFTPSRAFAADPVDPVDPVVVTSISVSGFKAQIGDSNPGDNVISKATAQPGNISITPLASGFSTESGDKAFEKFEEGVKYKANITFMAPPDAEFTFDSHTTVTIDGKGATVEEPITVENGAIILNASIPFTPSPAPAGGNGSEDAVETATDSATGVTISIPIASNIVFDKIEVTSQTASNVPAGTPASRILASFEVSAEIVDGSAAISFNVGKQYAGYYVDVYIDHEAIPGEKGAWSEKKSAVVDANGNISITVTQFSTFTLVLGDKATTKSPKTGVDTSLVMLAALIAAAGAAGASSVLYRTRKEQ